MWIQCAIFEILWFKLLVSQEDMLSFVHLAASIAMLLYGNFVTFNGKSMICPDDFGRYLTIIRDKIICDRGMGPALVRRWHLMATDKGPATIGLHHAVPARPIPLTKRLLMIVLFAVNVQGVSARNLWRGPLKVAAWAFGIIGDVPALYVLANPPRNVDESNEVWWWSHAWATTGAPVCAAIFAILLSGLLLIQTRQPFLVFTVVLSVFGMLVLQMGMRDSTWTVLDLLALDISGAALVSYIVVLIFGSNTYHDAREHRRQNAEEGGPALSGGVNRPGSG